MKDEVVGQPPHSPLFNHHVLLHSLEPFTPPIDAIQGHNSVPPEMWLLPNWFPFHPGRLWCHCRMVYLPMGYLYGSRFTYSDAETDPLIGELRKEVCYLLFHGLNFSCIPGIVLTWLFRIPYFIFDSFTVNRMSQSIGIVHAISLRLWTIIPLSLCL